MNIRFVLLILSLLIIDVSQATEPSPVINDMGGKSAATGEVNQNKTASTIKSVWDENDLRKITKYDEQFWTSKYATLLEKNVLDWNESDFVAYENLIKKQLILEKEKAESELISKNYQKLETHFDYQYRKKQLTEALDNIPQAKEWVAAARAKAEELAAKEAAVAAQVAAEKQAQELAETQRRAAEEAAHQQALAQRELAQKTVEDAAINQETLKSLVNNSFYLTLIGLLIAIIRQGYLGKKSGEVNEEKIKKFALIAILAIFVYLFYKIGTDKGVIFTTLVAGAITAIITSFLSLAIQKYIGFDLGFVPEFLTQWAQAATNDAKAAFFGSAVTGTTRNEPSHSGVTANEPKMSNYLFNCPHCGQTGTFSKKATMNGGEQMRCVNMKCRKPLVIMYGNGMIQSVR